MGTKQERNKTSKKSILFLIEDIAQLLRSEVKKTKTPSLDFLSYLHRIFAEFRNEKFKNN